MLHRDQGTGQAGIVQRTVAPEHEVETLVPRGQVPYAQGMKLTSQVCPLFGGEIGQPLGGG